jgi:hypothetical protein
MRTHHRTDRVLDEFELMLGAMAPSARKGLIAAFVTLDQGARLYPRSRGRRFSRLDDEAAEAYVRALLARQSIAGLVARRVKGVLVMCYYELPPVQREIGYDPARFIAGVSRRRLASYGPEIRAGEAAVTMRSEQIRAEQKVLDAEPRQPGGVLDAEPRQPGGVLDAEPKQPGGAP